MPTSSPPTKRLKFSEGMSFSKLYIIGLNKTVQEVLSHLELLQLQKILNEFGAWTQYCKCILIFLVYRSRRPVKCRLCYIVTGMLYSCIRLPELEFLKSLWGLGTEEE
jgi:hypothetical protein